MDLAPIPDVFWDWGKVISGVVTSANHDVLGDAGALTDAGASSDAGALDAATLACDLWDVASAMDARAAHLQSSLPRKITLIRTL